MKREGRREGEEREEGRGGEEGREGKEEGPLILIQIAPDLR